MKCTKATQNLTLFEEDSITMDSTNAERQVEEILSLQDQWYSDAIKIQTPALFNRLKRVGRGTKGTIGVKKCLKFTLAYDVFHQGDDGLINDLILEFEFPLDYPSDRVCFVKAISAKSWKDVADSDDGDKGKRVEYKACQERLANYLKDFVGCECVEMALDWVAQNKQTCLIETNGKGHSNESNKVDRNGKIQCYVLRYNHLLSGPEHKKEKAMLDTAKKSRLQGGLLWGTPGIVVVVPPSTEEDAKEYSSECRTIGKRPDGVEEIWLSEAGINDAGLGGLAQQKRGGKLQELDTAGLRMACGGDEHLLRLVLGVV